MQFWRYFIVLLLPGLPFASGEGKLVIRLMEPLREEKVTIRLFESRFADGSLSDLESILDLSGEAKTTDSINSGGKSRPSLVFDRSAGSIQVYLPRQGRIELDLLDLYGKKIRTLLEGNVAAGEHGVVLQDEDKPDRHGVRFVQLKIDGKLVERRMIAQVR